MASDPFVFIGGDPISAGGIGSAYFAFLNTPDPAESDIIDLAGSGQIDPGAPNVGLARSGNVATDQTTFNIAKNGTKIGEVTFAGGSNEGEFSFLGRTDPISFVFGDILEVIAPDPADATIANVRIVIKLV